MGLAVGLWMISALHQELTLYLRVSESAVAAIDETVGIVEEISGPSGGLEDSFMRLEEVLGELPSDLRVQGGHVRSLILPAHTLAQSTDQLALSLEQLREDLTRFEAVSDSYRLSLGEAEAAVEQARGSLQKRTAWLRVLVILASAVGITLGAVLIKTGRDLK